MPLNYLNLDDVTRPLMLKEIDFDIARGDLYESDNLSVDGRAAYPTILKSVVAVGDDNHLADELKPRLNSHEKPRLLQSGKYSKPPVMRSNAHEMLSEGEFNRFYMRALCLRTIERGKSYVEVYRAKQVENPRPESEAKIGQLLSAESLLSDLRARIGLHTILGLANPNSGLSVKLVDGV